MQRWSLALLLTALVAAPVPAAQAAQAAPPPQSPPFLAYLQGRSPALIAFNPSRFDPRVPASEPWPPASIAADLAALRPAFDGLVLYDTRPDMTPGVVEAAVTHHFRAVLLGIWDPRSAAEIEAAAALVRRWDDRIAFAVVLGNEGINDNRYRIEDLAAARERLRALIGPGRPPLPVTTSEPAGDYGWPPLLAFGDFLAPNIHPALDREGLDAEAAVDWVRTRARAIATAAGRPVLIKETGMPHGGAPAFTPERQRAFWAAWLARGRLEPVSTPPAASTGSGAVFVSAAAAFEAFDAPWKADALHNPIEGRWGLMSIERTPYPSFAVWVDARSGGR